MHRSGTSMICRALESIGLFTGQEKEHNHESLFFLTLNQWIFEQHGASWDNPYNMRFINEDLGGYLVAVLRNIINSPSATAYTGTDPSRQALFTAASGMAWGWKDPRNTFTADIWSILFPDAKVIHVCRNPLDVADSLRRREQETVKRHKAQLAKMQPGELDGTMRFQQSPRLFDLNEGLALWEEYTLQAVALEQRFETNAIRVRYEDFLAEPAAELARLARFAGLETTTDTLAAAVEQVNPARRYAFMENPELMSVYRNYRSRYIMKALGYDRLRDDSRHTAA
jgi:hypothetical protein